MKRWVLDWWRRSCGGWEILCQAIPLIISSGSISIMIFTDRLMLAWSSRAEMSASMQSGMLSLAAIAIPQGIAVFVTTFVAQYYGSRNYGRICPVVWQGVWFGFVLMPLLLFLEPLLSELFVFFEHEDLIELERDCLRCLLWGSGAAIGGESVAAFFRGRGKMHVEMNVNLFCLLLNIFLDYCLIFGKFGFPTWGLIGSAIATVICQYIRFGIYVVLMFICENRERRFNFFGGMLPDFRLIGRLFYYGTPSSSYTFIDTLTFTLFMMVIGGLGATERDATTIAFTINSFSFLPLLGVGLAVTSIVGRKLGEERSDLARRATNTAAVIGCAYTGILCILYLVFPNLILYCFSGFGANAVAFNDVSELTNILLRFIAVYLFFDCCAVVYSSALRGAGDTFFVLLVVIFLAPPVPILCFIGVKFFGLGILWCWTVFTVGLVLYFVCFFIRFLKGKWEKIRVI
ncbi:MAG: MATE family efflux transporter [Planctomycetaceae bacterium]|jgi:MATE family multidrug resistance protein|nr:MATE family efflux transporter [Planctomycetaceae bacterium]